MKYFKTRDVKSPERGTSKSAGIDFFIPQDFETTYLQPGHTILIPAGIKVKLPEGYALIANNKSGIAFKKQLLVGACVGEETFIKTNKGNINVLDLTKEYVKKNEIMIYSYNIESKEYEYCNFDGFRNSSEKELFKITFDDGSIEYVTEDHLLFNEETKKYYSPIHIYNRGAFSDI